MNKKLVVFALACAVFVGACGKEKPKGPFVPLVGRLPSDASLVMVADLSAASSLWSSKLDELVGLPVIANNPGLKQLVDEQLGLLRSAGRLAKGRLGFDPFHDLVRGALGLSLAAGEGEEVSVVGVLEGTFPKDLFHKAFPEATPRRVGEVEVFQPKPDSEVALVGETLVILTYHASMDRALAKPALNPDLLKRHPDLFAATGPGFIFRLSFDMPEQVRKELAPVAGQPAVSTLLGLKRMQLDAGGGLHLAIETLDDKTADQLHYLLQAEGQTISGSHHLLRGLALMCLALDLDALPNLPPQITQALADRKSLLATVDHLAPADVPQPKVAREGLTVSLSADASALRGALLVVGAISAAAIPAFYEYQAKARAAQGRMD